LGAFLNFQLDGQVWAGAILGTVLGFFASLLVPHTQNIINRTKDSLALKLRGFWVEIMPESCSSYASIGRIRFNVLRGQYMFDGVSFDEKGNQFAEWRTISSHLDYAHRKLHYSFITNFKATAGVENYGYGVVDLSECGKLVMPTGGCFVNVDKSALHIQVDMLPAPSDIAHLHADLGMRIVEIARKHNQKKQPA
jgi:hypothetical protein